MTSLLDIQRERFLETIDSVNPPNKWKVLVVDPYCERLINQVLPEYVILDHNVTTVHNIEKQRERSPAFEALYFVHPNRYNIDTIVQDFIDPPNRRYAAANIFFVSSADNRTISQLTNSPIRPIIRSLVDLNLDFTPIESVVFTTTTPDSFQVLYNPSCRALLDSELSLLSKKLVSLCASLGENPIIRFYRPMDNPHPARSHTARLAQLLQVDMDDFMRSNRDFPPKSNTRPRAMLLLCDRGTDVVTPLLHEFTYQAMAMDLLPIEDGKIYRYEFHGANGLEEKKATIDEKDDVWTSVRHMHMKDTIDKLMQDFNKFCQENTNFTDKEKATSLNDMRDMLAALPQFQEMRDQFSLHLNMAEKCMDMFEQKKLLENCATGLNPEGKVPKTVLEDIAPLLRYPQITDKMRMLMLYILFKEGITEEDLQLLLRHAGFESQAHELPLRNLDLLGPFRVTKSFAEHKAAGKSRRRPKAPSSDDESYELSRYVPPIKTVLEDLINGTLDPQTWAFTIDQPPEVQPTGQLGSLRTQRPTWVSKGKSVTTEARQRIIVFIAGGATYSESRTCYEVSKKWNRDVILGTTDMITPTSFVRDLSKARDSRRDLKLSVDQVRSMPAPQQRMDPQQASRPSAAAGRMPSSQDVPATMTPGGGRNGAAGVSGSRPGASARGYGVPAPSTHRPDHGVYSPPGGSGHKKSSSKDSKDGDKKDKKKKKLGIF